MKTIRCHNCRTQHSGELLTPAFAKRIDACYAILLHRIANILQQHQIEYTVSDGSLIGQLRNRRRIPWDDDLDIRVHRGSWHKLRPQCHHFPPSMQADWAPCPATPSGVNRPRGAYDWTPTAAN